MNTLNTKIMRGYLFVVPQRSLISETKSDHEYYRDKANKYISGSKSYPSILIQCLSSDCEIK